MKFLALFAVFVLSIPIFACEKKSVEDDFYENKMMKNLDSAAVWVIEKGIPTFYDSGKKGIHRRLVDDWGVQIWVDPWVETDRYLAQFRIKARGIHYDIHNLYREKSEAYFYEFWIIKVAAEDWAGTKNRSEFIITRAKDIRGQREIIKRGDQFISTYTTDSGSEVSLPTDDLELLYDMQAWLYPESYINSDINNKKVSIDNDGNFTVEDLQ